MPSAVAPTVEVAWLVDRPPPDVAGQDFAGGDVRRGVDVGLDVAVDRCRR
jgi:hypothetical protein